ncbi:MAG: hypothetical protein B6229_05350 [Spirochaetaceae bacterium 4572_7]|nr:MAG: hypothetical protein B6229_05350 [Spirochaetaceae bacterium 4572_7]
MKRNKIDSQIEQKESVFDSTNIPNISNIHKHIKRLKEQMAAPIELQDTNILYKLDNNGDYIDSGMYDENSKRKSNSIHGEKAIMKDKNNLPKVQEFFNSRKKELE